MGIQYMGILYYGYFKYCEDITEDKITASRNL